MKKPELALLLPVYLLALPLTASYLLAFLTAFPIYKNLLNGRNESKPFMTSMKARRHSLTESETSKTSQERPMEATFDRANQMHCTNLQTEKTVCQ